MFNSSVVNAQKKNKLFIWLTEKLNLPLGCDAEFLWHCLFVLLSFYYFRKRYGPSRKCLVQEQVALSNLGVWFLLDPLDSLGVFIRPRLSGRKVPYCYSIFETPSDMLGNSISHNPVSCYATKEHLRKGEEGKQDRGSEDDFHTAIW